MSGIMSDESKRIVHACSRLVRMGVSPITSREVASYLSVEIAEVHVRMARLRCDGQLPDGVT